MSQKTFRIGILGCGMIARFHAKVIGATARLELAGACSRNESSADAFCAEFAVPKYSGYEAMLADPSLDAVVLCTPSGGHYEQARQALLAGKHVIVEKPICLSLQDADALIDLADALGLMVCVISQSRFSDSARAIRNAVECGAFGKMVSAALTMRYQPNQSYYDQAAWRGTVANDGGVLMNQGIHGVDMLCYQMGRPVGVCGFARTRLRSIEAEDTAAAAVAFESGAVATIDATVCSIPSFSKKLTICGEKGTVILEEDRIALWSLPEPCPVPVGAAPSGSAAADPKGIVPVYHAREYENIAAHLAYGEPLLIDARQGRIPLSVILGVYESSVTGKTVRL